LSIGTAERYIISAGIGPATIIRSVITEFTNTGAAASSATSLICGSSARIRGIIIAEPLDTISATDSPCEASTRFIAFQGFTIICAIITVFKVVRCIHIPADTISTAIHDTVTTVITRDQSIAATLRTVGAVRGIIIAFRAIADTRAIIHAGAGAIRISSTIREWSKRTFKGGRRAFVALLERIILHRIAAIASI
jgi:hypothetical protein